MIDKIHEKYFQKSKSFLYPALGISRTSKFHPDNTFISIDGKIGAEEMKLICKFKNNDSTEFLNFESQMLLGNPLFSEKLISSHDQILYYVFDFKIYQSDWFYFLTGKYSKLSNVLKRAIKHYYGEESSEYLYIETYLYPEKYFEVYARLLDIHVDEIKAIGELCNSWNMDKEILKIPLEDLVVSNTDSSFVE